MTRLKSTLTSLALLATLQFAPAVVAQETIIHAGRLIDGLAAQVRTGISIEISGERIVAVTPGFVTRPGAKIVDLTGKTVLPGLVDCHVHFLLNHFPGDPIRALATRSTYDQVLASTRQAKAALLAGYTSVRDVGALEAEAAVALKRAITEGTVAGPRMWVSGPPLGPTAGPSDLASGLDPALSHSAWPGALIDGPEEARLRVRRLKRAGVDLVKIYVSGGVMSVGDNPQAVLLTDDEILAVVDTAHGLGMRVAAHAHGREAIRRAVLLGVDSIEHGSYADAEIFQLMKAKGTFLVPTLMVASRLTLQAQRAPETFGPTMADKMLEVGPRMGQALRAAYQAGVRIAAGSDIYGFRADGENAEELQLMVKAGLPPMAVLQAATANAAELLGASEDVGAIAAGRYADIIAVDGDPLVDISLLQRTSFVMKGGVVVRD